MTDLKEKLMAEKEILKADLTRPGVQLIFGKLLKAADRLPRKMINSRDPEEQRRIQAMYDVIVSEVPRIMDTIMNVDFELLREKEPGKKPWSFFGWVRR